MGSPGLGTLRKLTQGQNIVEFDPANETSHRFSLLGPCSFYPAFPPVPALLTLWLWTVSFPP